MLCAASLEVEEAEMSHSESRDKLIDSVFPLSETQGLVFGGFFKSYSCTVSLKLYLQ